MPREGELSRKSKDQLKMLCKTRIVRPTFRESPSRLVAKLFYSCDVADCGKTYTSPSSLSRHRRELHAPPQHECACGTVFKRLEYLFNHQQRCMKRNATTQTDFTLENSVICYTTIVLAYSKKSPPQKPGDIITMAPFKEQSRFNSTTPSESSEDNDNMNYKICARKPTRPMALDLRAKKVQFGCYMLGKVVSEYNLEEDLRLSEWTTQIWRS
jgi:hypothetical protein